MSYISLSKVVHFACRFNPPRTIIRHLNLLYPEGLNHADALGRLPLHYAAKWRASYRLIEYLIKKDQSAASVRDVSGKVPLHLMCESYNASSSADTVEDLSPQEHIVECIKVLTSVAPETVNIEDNDGITVLEYAIESEVPYEAIRVLQKASESDWKDRQRRSKPGEGTHKQIQEQISIRAAQGKDREMKCTNDISTDQVQLGNVQKTRTRYARQA